MGEALLSRRVPPKPHPHPTKCLRHGDGSQATRREPKRDYTVDTPFLKVFEGAWGNFFQKVPPKPYPHKNLFSIQLLKSDGKSHDADFREAKVREGGGAAEAFDLLLINRMRNAESGGADGGREKERMKPHCNRQFCAREDGECI